MSWIEKRSYFDSRNSTLGEEQINDRVSKLKKAINNYIQNTDDKRNTHFQEIQRLMTELNNIKEQYTKLNTDILNYLKDESKAPELSTLLTENGELQQKIQQLEKMNNEIKIDVESAVARDELLRSKNKEINSEKLVFGFIGKLSYGPNYLGLIDFINSVWNSFVENLHVYHKKRTIKEV